MKNDRRSKRIWKLKFRLQLLNYFLLAVIILNIFIFYNLKCVLEELAGSFSLSYRLIILSFCFLAVVTIFLICFLVFLHRGFGAIFRIEECIKKVLQGDYSVRISIRKKDFLQPFVDVLNKLLDLLESKTRNNQ